MASINHLNKKYTKEEIREMIITNVITSSNIELDENEQLKPEDIVGKGI